MLLKLPVRDKEIIWTAEERQLVKDYIKDFKGSHIEIKFCSPTGMNTLLQKGYLFGGVLPIISQHTGYTIDELLAIYYAKFSSYWIEVGGEEKKTIKTISQMNTTEMSIFTNEIIDDATVEWDIEIPPPEQYNKRMQIYANISK